MISRYLKSALGIVLVISSSSPAVAVSPLKGSLLCDPEVIRSIDGVTKNYDWEILADWQLAISEEKDGFVVSGARARGTAEGTVDLTGDVTKLLKRSTKVAHVNLWSISTRHDEECLRFLAVSSD